MKHSSGWAPIHPGDFEKSRSKTTKAVWGWYLTLRLSSWCCTVLHWKMFYILFFVSFLFFLILFDWGWIGFRIDGYLALKSARIVDLCCKSSGFADRGSAVIFEADSGLCLSYVRTLGPKRNLDHRSLFSLDRYVNEFIQIISFFERSSFYLRCETVIGIVLCCCHQARCLLYSLLFWQN